MAKLEYSKPSFQIHLLPLSKSAPGCDIKAIADGGACPVSVPDMPGITIFTDYAVGCIRKTYYEEMEGKFGICSYVPQDSGTIFNS